VALAFVLVNADVGLEKKVAAALRGLNEVREVWEVYGAYDLVARVEAETVERLKETVASDIRQLDNVRSTLTMITVQ